MPDLKTIRFTRFPPTAAYECSEHVDMSGEYVRVEDVKGMASALRAFVDAMATIEPSPDGSLSKEDRQLLVDVYAICLAAIAHTKGPTQ